MTELNRVHNLSMAELNRTHNLSIAELYEEMLPAVRRNLELLTSAYLNMSPLHLVSPSPSPVIPDVGQCDSGIPYQPTVLHTAAHYGMPELGRPTLS